MTRTFRGGDWMRQAMKPIQPPTTPTPSLMKVEYRSIAALTPHPLLRGVWQLPENSQAFLHLVESIRRNGVLQALLVTSDGKIADGRHRWRGAKIAGLDEAPCSIVSSDRAREIALETLTARRHLTTKGQLAYGAYPLFADRHEMICAQRQEGLQEGAYFSGKSGPSATELASELGVSRDLFFQAARLHALFEENEELRAEWEPRIMDPDEPIGLGAAIAGMAGKAATIGAKRAPTRNSALARFTSAWGNLGKCAVGWSRWNDESRDTAAEAVRGAISSMPDPLLDVLRDSLRAARRARNQGTDET